MTVIPSIRAFMAEIILQSARNLPARQGEQVLTRVPTEVVSLIEGTPRTGWIPIAKSNHLVDAMVEVLGAAGFRRVFSEIAVTALHYPLLQRFFAGATRLLGLSPVGLLKWSTHAWDYMFQGVGRLTYQLSREDADGGEVEMLLEGFPPEVLHTRAFLESLAGTFESYLKTTSRKGQVDVDEHGARQGRVVFRVSWR